MGHGQLAFGPLRAPIGSPLAVAAILAAVAAIYWWLLRFSLNHDTSWYVVVTRKWLGGAELYRDIVEINPPLAFYLTRPGLWLADRAGIGDKAGPLLFSCSIIALSLLLVRQLLAEASLTAWQRHGMMVASALALRIAPIEESGQRDYLMVVLALPYLMGQALRPIGLRVARSRGFLLAAFALPGLALRPYFLALPVCLTALEMRRRHSLRPVFAVENLTIGLGMAGYLTLIALRYPACLDEVVPLAGQVYGAYGFPALDVIANPALAALLLAAFVRRSAAPQGETGTTAGVLFAALLAFGVCYLVQFKGYRYQSFPVECGAILLVAWVLASSYLAVRHRPAPAIASVLGLSLTVGTSLYHDPYRADYVPALKAALPGVTDGQTIMEFSAHVWLNFPFV